jgi:hypothetical protein
MCQKNIIVLRRCYGIEWIAYVLTAVSGIQSLYFFAQWDAESTNQSSAFTVFGAVCGRRASWAGITSLARSIRPQPEALPEQPTN